MKTRDHPVNRINSGIEVLALWYLVFRLAVSSCLGGRKKGMEGGREEGR
jgi:hypothetical protein